MADGDRCRGLRTLKGTQSAYSAGEASKEASKEQSGLLAFLDRIRFGSRAARLATVWPQPSQDV